MFVSLKDVLCRRASLPAQLGTLVILGLVAFSSAQAQAPRSDDILARVKPLLATAQKGLDEIETDLTRIEQQAKIGVVDDRVSETMDRVAKSGADAVRILIEATGQRDKAKIAASFPMAFLEFEKAAKVIRDRGAKILDRYLAIQQGIAEGGIVVALEVFDKTTTRERVEFMNTLTPKAQDMYRRMGPTKFSGLDFQLQRLAMGLGSAAMSFGSGVKDACLPDANAAFAAICVAACSAGPGCAACVLTVAGGGAAVAINWYHDLKCNCCRCRWYKPWCCGCRVACWSAFLIWLG